MAENLRNKSITTFLVDEGGLDSEAMWQSSSLKGVSLHYILTFLMFAQILDLLILALFQPALLGNYS